MGQSKRIDHIHCPRCKKEKWQRTDVKDRQMITPNVLYVHGVTVTLCCPNCDYIWKSRSPSAQTLAGTQKR